MSTAITAYAVLMLGAGLLATAFPITYTLRAKWWKKPTGRALFAFRLVLALIVDLTVVGWFVTGDWFIYVAIPIVAAFDVVLAWWLVMLIRTQRTPTEDSLKEKL